MPEDTKDNVQASENKVVKGLFSRYTVIKFKGSSNEKNSRLNLSLFPFVGVMLAAIMLLLIIIVECLNNALEFDTWAFMLLIVIAVPFVFYGFKPTQGLMNVCERLFPKKGSESVSAASVMVPALLLLFIFVTYNMISGFGPTWNDDLRFDIASYALFYLPAFEIAATLAVVSTLYFSKVNKDSRYTGCVDTPGFIVAIVISLIACIVFSCVPILIEVGIEFKDVLMMILLNVFAVIIGLVLAQLFDKKLNGMSDSEVGASFELSRPILALFFIITYVIVFW